MTTVDELLSKLTASDMPDRRFYFSGRLPPDFSDEFRYDSVSHGCLRFKDESRTCLITFELPAHVNSATRDCVRKRVFDERGDDKKGYYTHKLSNVHQCWSGVAQVPCSQLIEKHVKTIEFSYDGVLLSILSLFEHGRECSYRTTQHPSAGSVQLSWGRGGEVPSLKPLESPVGYAEQPSAKSQPGGDTVTSSNIGEPPLVLRYRDDPSQPARSFEKWGT